jgi:hypothetical protein
MTALLYPTRRMGTAESSDRLRASRRIWTTGCISPVESSMPTSDGRLPAHWALSSRSHHLASSGDRPRAATSSLVNEAFSDGVGSCFSRSLISSNSSSSSTSLRTIGRIRYLAVRVSKCCVLVSRAAHSLKKLCRVILPRRCYDSPV